MSFKEADALEVVSSKLERVRDMISLTVDEMFTEDIGLYPYYDRYGSILDCALDYTAEQIDAINEISKNLYKKER